MKLRNAIAPVLSLVLTGCMTYKENDFNKYDKNEFARAKELAKLPIPFDTKINPNLLSYEQMLKVAKDYSGLSSQSLDIGFATSNTVSYSNLNLTGIRNSQYSTIRSLENVIGNGDSTSSLFIGPADSPSQQAREYQMNNQFVQGISFITSNKTNRNFALKINKSDGLVKDVYKVSIAFGLPDLIAKNKIYPIQALETVALDAGVGFWVGGAIGAIGFAGHTLVEEPIAYSMGRRNSKGTIRVRGQTPITQSSQSVANTYNTLEEAARQNTGTLLAVQTQTGAGVVYLAQKPDRVEISGNTLAFSLDKKDAYALFYTLMHLTKATVALGVDEKTFNIISGSSGPGSSGSSSSLFGSEQGGSAGK